MESGADGGGLLLPVFVDRGGGATLNVDEDDDHWAIEGGVSGADSRGRDVNA